MSLLQETLANIYKLRSKFSGCQNGLIVCSATDLPLTKNIRLKRAQKGQNGSDRIQSCHCEKRRTCFWPWTHLAAGQGDL